MANRGWTRGARRKIAEADGDAYMRAILSEIHAAEAASGPRDPAAPGAAFTYEPLPMLDLMPVRAWAPGDAGLCGTQANAIIVATYQALDVAFTRYLGGPPLSTWLTFGKYAAREVGSWVCVAESTLALVEALEAGAPKAQMLRALRALGEFMHENDLLGAACTSVRRLMGGALRGDALPGPPRRWLAENAAGLRAALVEGNTEIYDRIAFAYDLFMAAEVEGDGLEALRGALAAGAIDDALGYIQEGFALYCEARALGLRARAPGLPSEERRRLEAYRRQLVHQANLLIAVQEQALILQRPTIFDRAELHRLLGAARPGTLRLVLEPAGRKGTFRKFDMIPAGGSWADFATRMGFREVTHAADRPADAYVAVLGGRTQDRRYFVPDLDRRGTVLELFTQNLDGPASTSLRRGQPREISPLTRELDAYLKREKTPRREETPARAPESLRDAPGIALEGARV